MQFSIGVEYALHCLLSLVDVPADVNVGIKELATYQGVSETYLSKVFTRLQKSGIVRSTPGVKGGYELARAPGEITFWDVVEAVEGRSSLFQCQEIRKGCVLYKEQLIPPGTFSSLCTVHQIMLEAEQQMREFLRQKTLLWLYESRNKAVSPEYLEATEEWFRVARERRR